MQKIKRWFSPPVYPDDPNKTSLARHLLVLTWFTIIMLCIYGITLPIIAPQLIKRVLYILALLVLEVFVIERIHRGYVVFASAISLSGFWLVLGYTGYLSGGTWSAPIYGNILIILNASILLGRNGAFIFSGLSVLEGVTLLFLDSKGLMPQLSTTPTSAFLLQTVYFIVGAGALNLAAFSVKEALDRAKIELNERRHAEDALRYNEELLRSFIVQASEGLVLTDEKGFIIEWNQAQEDISGISHIDAVGKKLADIQFLCAAPERRTKEHHELIKNMIDNLLQSGIVPPSSEVPEVELYRPDGQRVIIQQAVFQIKSEKGNRLGAVTSDVTERHLSELALRESEEKFRKLSAELEQRVLERTAELEAANKELDSFSYSVSHDLRAPLRAIDGYAHLLQEDSTSGVNEDNQLFIQNIRHSTQKMSDLIDHLLAFSHISHQPLDVVELFAEDIHGMVDEVIKELKSDYTGRDITFTCGDFVACNADRPLLKQVFANLISNAIKFTRFREKALIEIGCQVRDGKPVFFVKDNGTGFDMRYANQLFNVFQRLHHQDEYEGSGVGLANVKRIIERHGGQVWADATPGIGATFFFTL
jgi:PAS domain S-box-containing protein